jgi:hypothetical protein
MAHLSLLLEPHEGWRQNVAMMVVGHRIDGVEVEDVDVIEAQPFQPRVHSAGHRFASIVAWPEYGLRGDQQPVSVVTPDRGTDDLLGSIGLRGVEKIDAQIDGRADDSHAGVEAGAAAEAQTAVAAAAKPGDARDQAGFSEWPIFHCALLLILLTATSWCYARGGW